MRDDKVPSKLVKVITKNGSIKNDEILCRNNNRETFHYDEKI
jgi:hypothetical protein